MTNLDLENQKEDGDIEHSIIEMRSLFAEKKRKINKIGAKMIQL